MSKQTGKRIFPDDQANKKVALERIKTLWRTGETLILPHAKTRMRQRGIDTNDLGRIIKSGRIVEQSRPEGIWRHTVQGRTIDGRVISCVVELESRVIIVTVIDER